MKVVGLILGLLVSFSIAQASDSAKCIVLMNGVEVMQKEVFHQDYDVQIDGLYSYCTFGQDEFYNLLFKYKTTSNPSHIQLDITLVGDAHTFQPSVSKDINFSEIKNSVIDHEGSRIEVICGLL